MLSKSLRPLPIVKEKEGKVFDAFTDPEQRYRQRYLDLIVNPQVKEVFVKRTRMINAIRNFFNSKGYLEVETPKPFPEERLHVRLSLIIMHWISLCICVLPTNYT